MNNIKSIFSDRIKHYHEAYQALSGKYNLIATVRVFVFLAFLVAFVFFANNRSALWMGTTALLFPFIFGAVVRAHKKISYQRRQMGLLKEINEKELRLNQGNLKLEDPGTEYLDKKHPYINDLDIFGSNSIFQFINRTTTKGGKDLLASWLSAQTNRETLITRQEAVKELSQELDWRQELEARGLHFKMQESNSDELIQWLSKSHPVSTIFKVSAWLFPLFIIPSVILNIYTNRPIYATLILVLVAGFILNRFQNRMKELSETVIKHISVLGAYATLLDQFENKTFVSKHLTMLQSKVSHDHKPSSEVINQLYKILDFLNSRNNMLYGIVNTLLLFDIHIISMAEKWKSNNKADVSEWFDGISELEALCSLAGFSYANPNFVYPTFVEEEFHLEAAALGHPLISESERVSNDYMLTGKGSITIITGSNMSGKSTFLRTLGVNISIAQAGGPVCAKSMKLSNIQLFTSMRTQDNLEEHVSSFYAELQRIQDLLELVAQEKPILYMLDEILKGTNSQDRHIGAVSLAKQLAKTNSFGLISTHDLSLGELANSMSSVSNFSFNSEINGDEIFFPYRLEKGICKSFNASKLMERIGIEISKN